MIIHKTLILIFLLLSTLFEQPQTDESKSRSLSNIDSLKTSIISKGWNENSLTLLETEIVNAQNTYPQQFLDQLPEGWEKTYLNSLLLKRESKFTEMYDSLFSIIKIQPGSLPYYNQLIFAASASSRLNFIEETINETELREEEYLTSLVLKSKSEFLKALEPARASYLKDSSDFNRLFNLYDIFRNTGDYDKGIYYISKALKIKNLRESELSEANYAAGTLLFLSGKYQDAEKYYSKGLSIASSNRLFVQIARGNTNLGIIEDLKGNTSEARVYFREAAETAGSIKDITAEAHALSELGVSYSFTNELVDAKRNYLESYHLFKLLGSRTRLAYLSDNIGKIYLQMFDYRSSLKYYEEGIQFAGDNKRAQVLNLTGIADVYANLSNYTKALLYYKEAEKIASEIKEAGLEAEINLGLGMLNFNLNRNNNALRYLNAAGDFSSGAGDPYLSSIVYHEMGLVYEDMDSLETAEALYEKSLALAVENGDSYMESLCLIEIGRLENNVSSLQLIERALRTARSNNYRFLIASGELAKGMILEKQGMFNPAKDAYTRCAETAKDINEPNLRISANHQLAELFRKNGMHEAASSFYSSAMKIVDDVSSSLFADEDTQISYFSGKRDLYDSYAAYLIERRYYANAFEVIDKSRSRSTIEQIKNLKLQEYVKDEDLLDKIYEYDWIINSGIYPQQFIDSVSAQYSALKNNILTKNPELGKYLDKTKMLELRDIQDNLNKNENMISLYSTDEGTYLFVISGDSFTHRFIQVSSDKISEMVSDISPYFNNNDYATYFNQHLFSFNAEAAYKMYDTLFAEVLKTIPEGEKIIISPSPELASFPFEFLVKSYNEDDSPYNYRNKDFLVKYYEISYTPSVNTYIEQKHNKLKNNKKVLVVGNPSINKQIQGYAERRGLLEETGGIPRNIALLPLKYSAQEVNDISGILSADKILLENSATESNFKNNASFSSIIHLSTHSFLHNKQPVIFFSNSYDPENDGFLEAGEIVRMQLNSDLVVLSSCNSGLGKLDASEGVLGMAKAFFETGTKSVIVSLWEVNDKYTAILMTLFYQRLKEGYDKSAALRMAKIDFINEYSPNPYYWSAFVLNGDTSDLPVKSNIHIQMYIAGLAGILLLALIISLAVRKNKRVNLQKA